MEQILLDIDTSKYAVYKYVPSDELCVINITDTDRLRNLALEYRNNPADIPHEETVEVFALSYDPLKRTYTLLENKLKKVCARDLESVVVQFVPRP